MSRTVPEAVSKPHAIAEVPASKLAAPALPEHPVVTIHAGQAWFSLRFRELWNYRELLYFLTWRDLKVRYKQTALGIAWVVMQPLMMTLIFTVFLGKLARVPSDAVPYPLFVFAGMLPWLFISGSVLATGTSLIGNSNLITKVYFPRILIPASIVGGRLIDFIVSFFVFIGLLIYYQVTPTTALLMLPLLIALMTLLALAIGMWAAAVNVKFRDVGVALPVLVQLWMFTSPIIYPSSLVLSHNISPVLRWLYIMNPMTGIIDNFRAAVLGTAFNWPALIAATVITLVLFVYSSYEFQRLETSFADLI